MGGRQENPGEITDELAWHMFGEQPKDIVSNEVASQGQPLRLLLDFHNAMSFMLLPSHRNVHTRLHTIMQPHFYCNNFHFAITAKAAIMTLYC